MIILLNIDDRKINVYTNNGYESIDFSDVTSLEKFVTEEDVIYVTGALKTNIEDVISTVQSIIGQFPPSKTPKEKLYFHSTKGNIIINDLNIMFKGPLDFKPLSSFDKDILENTGIKSLLKSKKLEIVKTSQIEKIREKANKSSVEKQSKIDKSLNNILIDSSIKAEDYTDEGTDEHDAVEIDLSSSGTVGSTNENSLIEGIDLDSLKQ